MQEVRTLLGDPDSTAPPSKGIRTRVPDGSTPAFPGQTENFGGGPLLSHEHLARLGGPEEPPLPSAGAARPGPGPQDEVRLSQRAPLAFLKVVPTSPQVPAMVSRHAPADGCWDHPVKRLGPEDDLQFMDFFDFDDSGFLDTSGSPIMASARAPDLVGHDALVQVQYVNVFEVDEA